MDDDFAVFELVLVFAFGFLSAKIAEEHHLRMEILCKHN